ncbi:MAG: response regulator transcription factor [Chloroflexia bacterium]|nr:response regulator transcription factor [Chloroflexia bacterium]
MKTIIVDDNFFFRSNLKDYIEDKLGHKVIAEASDGLDFLGLPNLSDAEIILMDIAMEAMDGFEATKLALWRYPHLKIIAVTMHSEKVFLVKIIQAGFKGCVFKPEIFDSLHIAIQTVIEGEYYIPDNISLEK